MFVANNHNYLLIFTHQGKVYWLRVYEIPEGKRASQGRSIQQLLQIEPDDQIRAVLNVTDLSKTEELNNQYVLMATTKGLVKKTPLAAYSNPRKKGIYAINIREGDSLLDVTLTQGDSYVLIATARGMAVRFHEKDVRSMGRVAAGVKAVNLADANDSAIGMVCVVSDTVWLLAISERGYGKRSRISTYRLTKRGAKGVKALKVTDKVGVLVAVKEVQKGDELMILTKDGVMIRTEIDKIRVISRNTQGVRIIKLGPKDAIAAVAKIPQIEGQQNIELD